MAIASSKLECSVPCDKTANINKRVQLIYAHMQASNEPHFHFIVLFWEDF
jgi:hypothetical protein